MDLGRNSSPAGRVPCPRMTRRESEDQCISDTTLFLRYDNDTLNVIMFIDGRLAYNGLELHDTRWEVLAPALTERGFTINDGPVYFTDGVDARSLGSTSLRRKRSVATATRSSGSAFGGIDPPPSETVTTAGSAVGRYVPTPSRGQGRVHCSWHDRCFRASSGTGSHEGGEDVVGVSAADGSP